MKNVSTNEKTNVFINSLGNFFFIPHGLEAILF